MFPVASLQINIKFSDIENDAFLIIKLNQFEGDFEGYAHGHMQYHKTKNKVVVRRQSASFPSFMTQHSNIQAFIG